MTFFQSDGSLDEAILLVVVGTLSYIGYYGYDLIKLQHAFNGTEFGTGLAAIWAGTAALMKFRPQVPLPPQQPTPGASA